MRTILATLAIFFAMASLAVAEEEKVIRVGLHLDAFVRAPEPGLLDQLLAPDKPGLVRLEPEEIADLTPAALRVFRIVGLKVGEAKLTFTFPDDKKQIFRVQVVEKLDEPSRKDLTLRVGDDAFLDLERGFADGRDRPLFAVCRHQVASMSMVNSRRVQIAGLAPGMTGLSFRSARGVVHQYRVTVLAADAKRPDGIERAPLSVRRGEARLVPLPKGFSIDVEQGKFRPKVLPALEEKVSGIVANATHFVLCGHERGECDVSMIDANNTLHRYRVTVSDGKIEPPAGDQGLADLGLKKTYRLKVGEDAELPLDAEVEWSVFQTHEEQARDNPDGFSPITKYVRAVNPAVVAVVIEDGKAKLSAKAAGATDIILVNEWQLVGIYRVQVE